MKFVKCQKYFITFLLLLKVFYYRFGSINRRGTGRDFLWRDKTHLNKYIRGNVVKVDNSRNSKKESFPFHYEKEFITVNVACGAGLGGERERDEVTH